MPPPLRRKRRSFGGKDGVWFRRKTCSTTQGEHEKEITKDATTEGKVPSKDSSPAASIDNGMVVEWDEALARPVYRRLGNADTNNNKTLENHSLANFNSNHVSSSSSSDDSEEEHEEKKPRDGFFQSKLIFSTERSAKKRQSAGRSRTFGGRSRRPLSLLLEDCNHSSSPTASSKSSITNNTSPSNQSESNTSVETTQTPKDNSTRIAKTNEDPEKENNLPTTDHGIQSSVSPSTGFSSDTTSHDKRASGSEEDHLLDFVGSLQESSAALDVPKTPTHQASLEEAQRYFAHLDASHPLQLDSSESPTEHGRRKRRNRRLIRTSRKIQLTSPGFVREYSKYAEASKESGFSPLTTVDYAKSRREFFRRAELFNGFVDS